MPPKVPGAVYPSDACSDPTGIGAAARVSGKCECLMGWGEISRPAVVLLDPVELNEPALRGCNHCFGSINHLELAENVLDMDLHRILRDA